MTTSSAWAAASGPGSFRRRGLVILVMQCLVVLICVGVTTAISVGVQERSIRVATEERVLAVAQSLAALPQVRDSVVVPRAEATAQLQPLADIVAAAAGVDYVVLTDAAGIRLTHPTPSERGLPVSTDASDVLAGDSFLGTETGTLGPTLRAKVPVRNGERVVGTASVGVLESEIAADFTAALEGLVPWVIGSVVVGCVASAALTAVVRRRVRRLEGEVAELAVQRRIADALRDQTHEFRTRLHVIGGLVAEGDSAAALEYIGRISPVTSSSDVSSLEGMDAGLRAILADLAGELDLGGGRLAIDPLTSAPRGALDDDVLTVIANLGRNAVEAVHGAGEVSVMLRSEDDAVHIDVADDGPGISPADAAHIFERGVSSKASDTTRGVGLDLVRQVVVRRGGTVTVGRSATGGARFTVELPRTPSRVGS